MKTSGEFSTVHQMPVLAVYLRSTNSKIVWILQITSLGNTLPAAAQSFFLYSLLLIHLHTMGRQLFSSLIMSFWDYWTPTWSSAYPKKRSRMIFISKLIYSLSCLNSTFAVWNGCRLLGFTSTLFSSALIWKQDKIQMGLPLPKCYR